MLYILLSLIFQIPVYSLLFANTPSPALLALYSGVGAGEFLIFLGLTSLLANKIHKIIKPFFALFIFLFILFYNAITAIQIVSLYTINDFIPAIALENKESVIYFINIKTISIIILLIVISLFQTILLLKISNKQEKFHYKKLFAAMSAIALGVIFLFSFGGKSKYSQGMSINGPIVEFCRQLEISVSDISLFLKDVELTDIEEKSWIKDTIYTSDRQFLNNTEKPNIIFLIPDGIPARLINGYQKLWGVTNNPLGDLTPNIDNMMKSSFVIDNYYNHTAATYPGLVGTFTSSFPFRSMLPVEIKRILFGKRPAPNFSSIFDILKLNGYKSYAITANGEEVYIPQLHKDIIKIDTLYYPKTIKEINPHAPAYKYLTEREIFDSIKNILTASNKQPAAISTYFVTTHLNINPLDFNGIGYKDNKNIFLSALHNFDHELGLFMDWLQKSPFARNTLVILTSDHTHFPDKEYQEIMKKYPQLAVNFQPYFTDKIPFIISNTHNLPSYYNAEGKTSLYFAATLMHILGHKNYRNAFLEGSIFDEKLPADEPFIYYEPQNRFVLCIIENKMYPEHICQKHEKFNQKLNAITIQQKLELQGLLFDNQYE